jgi:signal transduction histidine kinase
MHDVLAHKVSLIALHAGALELHAGGDPARVQQGAALIRVTAREALQELREVLSLLQAAPGGPERPIAWFPDLASLVEASTRAGQHVELRDDAGPLPPATARVVYRIVQEGLTNAHRYAPGAPTTVSVRGGDGGDVAVTVHNAPGAGAPIDLPGSGSGLVGLAERIRLVGGSLRSGPSGRDGRDGWQLQAVVPWLDHHVEEAANGAAQ